MDEWTVVLKTDAGLSFEVVEADYGFYDEKGDLLFKNVKALTEMLKALKEASEKGDDLTEANAIRIVEEIVRAFGGEGTVATFKAEYVVGFFRGRRAIVDITLKEKKD